jgi:HK97 family phage portal protein
MDLMARLFGMADGIGTPGPTADYWYQPVGTMTAAGVAVDAETAKKISAWFRGREILSNMLAMLPLQVMARLPEDGGSEPARDHELYDVLHDQPNDFQDSFEWRREHMYDLIDHGWAYDWIVPGLRGFADQLVPIDPQLVTPRATYRRLANGAVVQGRWLFDVRDPQTGQKATFTQDEIFYRRSASGKGILEHARGSLGTATATETYAANVFSRGALNAGVIENPGVLNADAAKRMAQSFVTSSRDWHLPKVLEQGSKWIQTKMTPEDAQMLASRQFTVDDIARWLGVPRMMLENSDPSFGNGEQFTQNFLDINMGGWLMLWESASNTQLILDPAAVFRQVEPQSDRAQQLQGSSRGTRRARQRGDRIGRRSAGRRGHAQARRQRPMNCASRRTSPASRRYPRRCRRTRLRCRRSQKPSRRHQRPDSCGKKSRRCRKPPCDTPRMRMPSRWR